MSTHLDMAKAVMLASRQTLETSFLAPFLTKRGVKMPETKVGGALEGWKYNLLLPKDVLLPVHALMQFSIGDFLAAPNPPCSSYFDPTSGWYNVFYGSYAVLSGKPDGEPFGFDSSGKPNFPEFSDIPRIDYTYLTAGMFGCPPQMMNFKADATSITPVPPSPPEVLDGWHQVQVEATIPSGLHRVPKPVDYPLAYLMYGVPDPAFLAASPGEYHPVAMRGQLFMKLMGGDGTWITFVWGALCPVVNGGPALLNEIITQMSLDYLRL
jgi:hypothetical protein